MSIFPSIADEGVGVNCSSEWLIHDSHFKWRAVMNFLHLEEVEAILEHICLMNVYG
jgi:hypothetical protein